MKVITTIGTSLIENLYRLITDKNFNIKDLNNQECNNKGFKSLMRTLENLRKDKDFKNKYEKSKFANLLGKYSGVSFKLVDFSISCFPNSSAELTSLYKLKEKYPNDEFIIYLLTSDTFEGYFVGEILKEVLEDKKIKKELKINKIELIHIPDLRVDDTKTFEKGINDLIDKIYTIIVKDENNKKVYEPEEVIFNISGGYKGVIPYFSTIAQIFNYDIVYTFEDTEKGNDLIEVKPLPLGFDEDFTDLYLPFLFEEGIDILNEIDKKETELKNIAKNSKNPDKEKIEKRIDFLRKKRELVILKRKLLGYKILVKENKLKLSPLGTLIRLKSENKKTKLGYIFELLLVKALFNSQQNLKIEISKKYQINGKNGEIDIFLDKGNSITAIEIKSITKFYKSKEQIERHIKYLQNLGKTFELEIILYILDELILDTKRFKNFVREIKNLSPNIKIKYFEYKPQKLDALIKNFDSEITLKEWIEGGNSYV